MASALEGADRHTGLDPRVALGKTRPASRKPNAKSPRRPPCYGGDIPNRVVQSLVEVDVRPALRDTGAPGPRRACRRQTSSATRCGGSVTRSSATRPTRASRSAGERPCIRRSRASSPNAPPGGASKPTSSSATTWSPRTARKFEVDQGGPELAGLAADAGATPGRSRPPNRTASATSGDDCRAAAPGGSVAPSRCALAPRTVAPAPGRRAQLERRARCCRAGTRRSRCLAASPGDERTHARLEVARLNLAFWGPREGGSGGDVRGLAQGDRRARSGRRRRSTRAHPRMRVYHMLRHRRSARTWSAAARGRRAVRADSGSTHVPRARASSKCVATSWLCVLLRRGWQPVEEARRRIHAILEDPPDRYTRAAALGGLGTLHAMEGSLRRGPRPHGGESRAHRGPSGSGRPPLRIRSRLPTLDHGRRPRQRRALPPRRPRRARSRR